MRFRQSVGACVRAPTCLPPPPPHTHKAPPARQLLVAGHVLCGSAQCRERITLLHPKTGSYTPTHEGTPHKASV
jgi:hypothetical protein